MEELEVEYKSIDVDSFVASGIEVAYKKLFLYKHLLVRDGAFTDVIDLHNGGSITVASGAYIELGGV